MKDLRYAVLGLLLCSLSTLLFAAEQKLTPEQLLQKHQAAIGTPEAIAAVKTRVAQGSSNWQILTGGTGSTEGKATLVSEGRKLREVLRFTAANYSGEDLLTDGNQVRVVKGYRRSASEGMPGVSLERSLLGEFLFNQSALVREGVFSGTLSTAWPLLDMKSCSAKLSYRGLKSIEGRQLHEVKYSPKKSDAGVLLYFDQDFRHVMTIITMSIEPRLQSGGEIANTRQQTVRYRLVETFDGFQQVDGLTLPTSRNVTFSAEGYESSLVKYATTFSSIQNNVQLDARNFEIR